MASVLPPSVLPHFDTNSTLGALEIGVLVSAVLFGVTTTQAYIYYGRFPDDSRGLKFLVVFVWSCEVAHLVCIGQTLYQQSISDFEEPQNLIFMPTALAVALLLSGIIGACVQGFFSLRIYRLSKSLYIPSFTWSMSFLWLVFTILGSIYASHPDLLITAFEVQRAWIFYIIWITSTVNDLIIAAALVYWLYRQRMNAHTRTLALVDTLIKWTIETGVITSTASILTLILYVTMKDNFIWVAFYTVISRLYANSLLASLNSRVALRTMNEISLPFSAPAMVNTPGNIHFEVSRSTCAPDAPTTVSTPAANFEMSKMSYAVD
ncbi:hypothetical protein C8R44DRAFT_673363 [Mycena epipterygia]|nr:hypothetical protein C8R44DRAFT_673363 [Mycena epipterygia]